MSRYLDQLTGDATGPSVDELRASFTRTRGTPLPPVPSHSSEQYLGRLHGVNIAGSGSTIGERIANGHEMAVKALAAAERRRAALSHPYAKSALELAEARARKKGRSYVTETDLNKSMSQLTKSLGPVAAPPRPPWVALVRKHPETSDPGIRVSR